MNMVIDMAVKQPSLRNPPNEQPVSQAEQSSEECNNPQDPPILAAEEVINL